MSYKSLPIFLITLFFSGLLNAQNFDYTFPEWEKPEYAEADAGKNSVYFNPTEKEVLKLINFARMNGPLFARTYLVRYFENYKVKKTAFVSSLIDQLEVLTPLKPLTPSKGLSQSARDHAYDLGKNGKTGHVGTDGSRMAGRIERYVQWGEVIAENCNYGGKEPIDIVCSLLIDEGVNSLGHRKNILSMDHKYIGIAFAFHTTYKFNCVMDFAGSILSEK